jgi:hypothetical protein
VYHIPLGCVLQGGGCRLCGSSQRDGACAPPLRILRNVSLRLRNVSLRLRNVSLRLRNVSLRLRNVSLRLRNVSLRLRNVSLRLRNVSFGAPPPAYPRTHSPVNTRPVCVLLEGVS